MPMTNAQADGIADDFIRRCEAEGWSWSIADRTVKITRRFTPGDTDAFIKADMDAYYCISLIPSSGGSQWGTDGGSCGGQAGLDGGYYHWNQSGCSNRVLDALARRRVTA